MKKIYVFWIILFFFTTPIANAQEELSRVCPLAFEDLDEDGVHDPDEGVMPGVLVILYTDEVYFYTQIITDSPEPVCFGEVIPGTYTIEFVIRPHMRPTTQNSAVLEIGATQQIRVEFGVVIDVPTSQQDQTTEENPSSVHTHESVWISEDATLVIIGLLDVTPILSSVGLIQPQGGEKYIEIWVDYACNKSPGEICHDNIMNFEIADEDGMHYAAQNIPLIGYQVDWEVVADERAHILRLGVYAIPQESFDLGLYIVVGSDDSNRIALPPITSTIRLSAIDRLTANDAEYAIDALFSGAYEKANLYFCEASQVTEQDDAEDQLEESIEYALVDINCDRSGENMSCSFVLWLHPEGEGLAFLVSYDFTVNIVDEKLCD